MEFRNPKVEDFQVSLDDLVQRILDSMPDPMRRVIAACAILHWFDAAIINDLLLSESIAEISQAMNFLVDNYSFIGEHPTRGYTFHENIRYSLLLKWSRFFPEYDFAKLSIQASQLFRKYSAAAKDTALKRPYYLEALYQSLAVDLQTTFPEFLNVFEDSISKYNLEECNVLVRMASEPQIGLNEEQKLWLEYLMARITLASGKSVAAREQLESLLSREEFIQDQKLLALIDRDLGLAIKNSSREWSYALEYFQRSLKRFQTLEDWLGYGSVSLALSILYRELGNASWDRSFHYGEQAVAAFEKINSVYGVAKSQIELGLLNWLVGKSDQALELYNKALVTLEGLGNRVEVARVYAFLGRLYRQNGNWAEGEQVLQKSVEILEAEKNLAELAWSLNALGNLLRDEGKPSEAESVFERSIVLHDQLGQVYEKGVTLKNLIDIYGAKKDWEHAAMAIEESLSIFRNLGSEQRVGEVLIKTGDVYFAQGMVEKARAAYEEALDIVRRFDFKDYRPHILVSLGRISFIESDLSRAQDSWKQALELAQQRGLPEHASRALLGLGQIALRENRSDEAIRCFQQALSLAVRFNAELGHNVAIQIIDTVKAGIESEMTEASLEVGKWFSGHGSQIPVDLQSLHPISELAELSRLVQRRLDEQ